MHRFHVFLAFLFVPFASVLLAASPLASAQIITPHESSVVLQAPKKIGINLNGPTYYQGGEIYKNLLWRNPGFEPDLYRDKFVAFTDGTTTSFPSPNPYDPVIQNFWAGATFRLYRGEARTLVCSGSIAGNSVSANNQGPVYTFTAPCSSAVQPGDVIILRQAIACTAEAVWEGQGAGWWGYASGGGKLLSECAAPFDGVQSLRLDATAAGSSAGVKGYVDTNPTDTGILIDGQYAISGFYKTEGNATLSVSGRRLVTSAAGNPFSCALQTFPASSAWTAFTVNCPGMETAQVAAGPIQIDLASQGGVVLLDDVTFQKAAGTDPANTTVFRDELLTTLKAHCAGASLAAVPCELRDWAFQNADEIENTIRPAFTRRPTLAGLNYDYPPNGAIASMSVGLEEFLELCRAVDAEPYYTLPETTGPEDAAAWVEYLNGAVLTPYGARRAASGQTASWLTVFPTIHLPMGNENWNEGTTGQGLGFRPGAPDYYYDYSVDAAGVWAAMRGSASWPAGGVGLDLVLGLQTANANYGVAEAMARANPTSAELAPYTQAYVGDTGSLPALWNPLLYEVVANVTNPATQFYQQGTAIKSHARLNVYEFDNGTSQGSASLTQSVLDRFTDAAGYGTATALQALEHLSFGIVDQNFFSLDQYAFSIPNLGWVHNWGAVIDMGGATNAVRPQELGMRMANAAIIGPMYDCGLTAATTYDLPANHNGQDSNGVPATSGVAQQYAFCFKSGTARSMIVINTDVSAAHAVTFAGAQAPAGPVTVTRYAPSSISATNEATADNNTAQAPQNVSIDAPFTVAALPGDALPPFSINRYDWTSSGSSALTPTTLQLTASSTQPATGASVTLEAIVSSSTATGSVLFAESGVVLGSASVQGGAAFLTVLGVKAGDHSYTAAYAGDATFAPSASPVLVVSARTPVQIGLAASSLSPSGGSALVLSARMSDASIAGVLTFFDGSVQLGTAPLLAGAASFSVAAITPGSHAYTAVFAGDAIFAAATSPAVTVNASSVPTQTSLAVSNSQPSPGSIVALTATVSPAAAGGSVTFFDGTTLLQTVPLTSGAAVALLPPVAFGAHSFQAIYNGDAAHGGSASPLLPVVASEVIPYLQTGFYEFPAGTAVNGTVPANNAVRASWSDPNSDWRFIAPRGIAANTADLGLPLTIDSRHSDYTARYKLVGSGGRFLFRYKNLNNLLLVVVFKSEVDLYSTVNGVSTKLATIAPSVIGGLLTVTLKGSSVAISMGGQTASATVPSALIQGTKLGVLPTAAGFTLRSLDVVP